MKIIILLFLIIYSVPSISVELFCSFKKKAEVISFIESLEIENNEFEENQLILQTIKQPLTMKIYDDSVTHIIENSGRKIIIEYAAIKKNINLIFGLSEDVKFAFKFFFKTGQLLFLEFHDGNHLSTYFYQCEKIS